MSNDGRRRAEGVGNRVRVFEGGHPLGDPLLHDDVVRAVAFSSDGQRLITGGDDHSARVWKYDGGWRLQMKVEHQEYVQAITFSPDGRLVATGGADGAAQVWEADTGRRVGQLLPHIGWVEAVAFSPDGTQLVTTTADGVERVWELSAAAVGERWTVVNADVFALAPTPDGTAVYAGTKSGVVRLSASDPVRWTTVYPNVEVWAVAVHPRGTLVAAGGPTDGQTGWFNVTRSDGGDLHQFKMPQPVRSIAFDGAGTLTLLSTATTIAGGVWVWDAATPDKEPRPLEQGQPAWAVVASPNGGRYVTSIGDGLIRGWECGTHSATGFAIDHPPRSVALAFHLDGTRLVAASTDGRVRSWDTTTGEERWSALHRGAVWAMAVSPDGTTVASGGRDRCVRLWDANTGRAMSAPLGHGAVVWAVAISPDGKWVWSGSEDGTVRRRMSPSTTLDVPDGGLRLWAEQMTGLALGEDRARPLTTVEWRNR